jgi:hypothetical protein
VKNSGEEKDRAWYGDMRLKDKIIHFSIIKYIPRIITKNKAKG